MGDKDENLCRNHIVLHTKYLWNLYYRIQEIKQELRDTFRCIIFERPSWKQYRKLVGGKRGGKKYTERVRDSNDFLNDGSALGATETHSNYDKTNWICSLAVCCR